MWLQSATEMHKTSVAMCELQKMIDLLKRRRLSSFEHIEPKFLKVVPQAFHPVHLVEARE